MVKKLEALTTGFKTYHCTIHDQIEDQDKLTKEPAVLDDHEDKVEDITEHLEDLVMTTEPVMPHASDMGDHRPAVRSITEAEHLSRRLSQVHDFLTKVKRVVEEKEMDICLLKGHEQRLMGINFDLQGIKRDMLLMDETRLPCLRTSRPSLQQVRKRD